MSDKYNQNFIYLFIYLRSLSGNSPTGETRRVDRFSRNIWLKRRGLPQGRIFLEFTDMAPRFGGQTQPPNPNFMAVDRHFQAKRVTSKTCILSQVLDQQQLIWATVPEEIAAEKWGLLCPFPCG